jgi:alkylated DNA repair protein (DNA oxidative demethylase)
VPPLCLHMVAAPPDTPPPGFRYVPDFITAAEEANLMAATRALEFSDVVMRGQTARRRVAHFGWRYGYESFAVTPGPPLPPAFLPLRRRVADLIQVEDEALAELLVTAYPPGAGIGWHRDAPAFDTVVGVSLLSPCRFRFQRGEGAARRTRMVVLDPRSAYVLAGEARWQWQHTIPAMKVERHSLTFRTLSRRGR